MPIIATTTSNSISVKPEMFFFTIRAKMPSYMTKNLPCSIGFRQGERQLYNEPQSQLEALRFQSGHIDFPCKGRVRKRPSRLLHSSTTRNRLASTHVFCSNSSSSLREWDCTFRVVT